MRISADKKTWKKHSPIPAEPPFLFDFLLEELLLVEDSVVPCTIIATASFVGAATAICCCCCLLRDEVLVSSFLGCGCGAEAATGTSSFSLTFSLFPWLWLCWLWASWFWLWVCWICPLPINLASWEDLAGWFEVPADLAFSPPRVCNDSVPCCLRPPATAASRSSCLSRLGSRLDSAGRACSAKLPPPLPPLRCLSSPNPPPRRPC